MSIRHDQARLMRETFTRDMARHQREINGTLPTPGDNEQLVADFLERYERKKGEEKPAPFRPGPPERQAEKRAREAGWTLTREPDTGDDPPLVKTYDAFQAHFAARLNARIRLLLEGIDEDGQPLRTSVEERGPGGAPSWRDRVLAAIRTWQVDRRRGVAELLSVVEDSSASFGDWKKEPPRRSMFA